MQDVTKDDLRELKADMGGLIRDAMARIQYDFNAIANRQDKNDDRIGKLEEKLFTCPLIRNGHVVMPSEDGAVASQAKVIAVGIVVVSFLTEAVKFLAISLLHALHVGS